MLWSVPNLVEDTLYMFSLIPFLRFSGTSSLGL